jgi:hypothetical protein
MNYAVVVLAIITIISVCTWVVDGRKHFTGPRDLDALLELARADIGTVSHGGKNDRIQHEAESGSGTLVSTPVSDAGPGGAPLAPNEKGKLQ